MSEPEPHTETSQPAEPEEPFFSIKQRRPDRKDPDTCRWCGQAHYFLPAQMCDEWRAWKAEQAELDREQALREQARKQPHMIRQPGSPPAWGDRLTTVRKQGRNRFTSLGGTARSVGSVTPDPSWATRGAS